MKKEIGPTKKEAALCRDVGCDVNFLYKLFRMLPPRKREFLTIYAYEMRVFFSQDIKDMEAHALNARYITPLEPSDSWVIAAKMAEKIVDEGKMDLVRGDRKDGWWRFGREPIHKRAAAYRNRLVLFADLLIQNDMVEMPSDLRKKYLRRVYRIFRVDQDAGICSGYVSLCAMARLFGQKKVYQDCVTRTLEGREEEGNGFLEKYFNAVEFLIDKTLPKDKNIRAEGLLGRVLDKKNITYIARAFNNQTFLQGYLYGDRLPPYSWSETTGLPMQGAMKSGEYGKNYHTERRLIKSVVRKIGERYGQL